MDIKLLWGRAGGMCSKPGCTEDLTKLLEAGNYIIGEMAHVIGRKPSAKRSRPEGGEDIYDNLILLCPTHHKHIDKAPEGTYPASLLHEWKRKHEEAIRQVGAENRFDNFEALRTYIFRLILSNRVVFERFGPKSIAAKSDPTSNLFLVWELRRLDRILPNNREILNVIDSNINLIPANLIRIVEEFRAHAEAYEQHVYDKLDTYPLFPDDFAKVFGSYGK